MDQGKYSIIGEQGIDITTTRPKLYTRMKNVHDTCSTIHDIVDGTSNSKGDFADAPAQMQCISVINCTSVKPLVLKRGTP